MRTGVAGRHKGMSRVIVQTHVTLDGVIDSPPEALLPYMSDEGRQDTLELALACDALLLGRVTWQRLASAWRERAGAMAERFNAMAKYVVTSTLSCAEEWDNSTIVGYGEIAGLREQLDLLSYGCGALARDLLRDRLLDELHLNVTPVLAGRGRRLFDEPAGLLAFQLVDSRTYPTGAVHLVIRPEQATEREYAHAARR